MYKDGWWLAMRTPRIPWVLTPAALKPYAPGVWDPDSRSGRAVLPARRLQPGARPGGRASGKVAELKELFWAEAERYKVLPLLATLSTFFGMLPPLPEQARFEFRGDVQNVLSG
jgi:hypothetical protein